MASKSRPPEHVRKRDYDEVKRDAQAIYWAENRRQAEAAFRDFRRRWQRDYGPMVRRLERDLPELLSFFISYPLGSCTIFAN
jgi:transposase-like protein